MSAESPYRNPDWIPPHLIIGSIAIIICLYSLCYSIYIYKTYRAIKNQTLPLSLKLLNLCGILSFLFCAISQSIGAYYYNHIYWEWTTIQTLLWHFTWLFWSCGQFFSYLLFLNRIKQTFAYSVYAPSQPTFIYIYALLVIFGITWLIANIVPFLIFIPNDGVTRKLMQETEFYCSLPIMIIDIIITISMTTAFVSRLYKLTVSRTQMQQREISKTFTNTNTDHDHDHEYSKNEPLIFDDTNRGLIDVSVKITILAVTSLLSSVILIMFRAIVNFIAFHKSLSNSLLYDVFQSFWLQIDTIISCLCFLLFLPKTEKGFKWLCCLCIEIVSKCMKRSVYVTTMEFSIKHAKRTAVWTPVSIPVDTDNNSTIMPLDIAKSEDQM